MASISERQLILNIQHVIEKIVSTGKLSRQDYLKLTTLILSESDITEEQRSQINRIFDDVQFGRITLVE